MGQIGKGALLAASPQSAPLVPGTEQYRERQAKEAQQAQLAQSEVSLREAEAKKAAEPHAPVAVEGGAWLQDPETGEWGFRAGEGAKTQKPEDIVKEYSSALAQGDKAKIALLAPRVKQFYETTTGVKEGEAEKRQAEREAAEAARQQATATASAERQEKMISAESERQQKSLQAQSENLDKRLSFEQEALDKRLAKTEESKDKSLREKVVNYYDQAMNADTRLQLMRQSAENAKQGDQQAMVNILSNHVAMVQGIPRGKVPRVSQQMFKEAQESSPVLKRIAAHFDKEGYLTGVVLTPQQIDQMLKLGQETRDTEWQTARNKAHYVGVYDEPTSLFPAAGGGPTPSGAPEVGSDEHVRQWLERRKEAK